MWWRSTSFILDRNNLSNPQSLHRPSSMADTLNNPNPTPIPINAISSYYQTRAAHHGVLTCDWLTQSQATVGREPEAHLDRSLSSTHSENPLSIIKEFNNRRKQLDLAEAVVAIRALAFVIRSSEATTMMELQTELKTTSYSLKLDAVKGKGNKEKLEREDAQSSTVKKLDESREKELASKKLDAQSSACFG